MNTAAISPGAAAACARSSRPSARNGPTAAALHAVRRDGIRYPRPDHRRVGRTGPPSSPPGDSTSWTSPSAATRAAPKRRGTKRASWSRRRSESARSGGPDRRELDLADPVFAESNRQGGQVDIVMLGRPMLANPHWPVYAAMVLGEARPYDMLPVRSKLAQQVATQPRQHGFGTWSPMPHRSCRITPDKHQRVEAESNVSARKHISKSRKRSAAGPTRMDHGVHSDVIYGSFVGTFIVSPATMTRPIAPGWP